MGEDELILEGEQSDLKKYVEDVGGIHGLRHRPSVLSQLRDRRIQLDLNIPYCIPTLQNENDPTHC